MNLMPDSCLDAIDSIQLNITFRQITSNEMKKYQQRFFPNVFNAKRNTNERATMFLRYLFMIQFKLADYFSGNLIIEVKK